MKNIRAPATRRKSRLHIARATARRLPKMHWRWCWRSRDIEALLARRFGLSLPNDDAGMDAVKLLAQHYMRLHIDAERITSANLRLWAPWLTGKVTAKTLKAASKAKTTSAAALGRSWQV